MSQRPPEHEERLSGTILTGVQNLLDSFRGLSAPFGLGGVTGLVLGLVLLVFIPDLRFYSYLLLGIGGVLLAISMIISFRTVGRAAASRSGRYGTNTAIMVAVFIGIAAIVNFLSFENPKRLDVTATKQFDLAPRTLLLLDNLREPVEAKVFLGPPNSFEEEAFQEQVEDMLQEFEVKANNFSYEFIDPDREPEVAREYGLRSYGNTVFESMESKRQHQVSPSGFLEQDFVTALLIVTGEEQKQVYFLTGHGERNINDLEETTEGFGTANNEILAENYGASPLDLSLTSDKEAFEAEMAGDGVNMVVIAGPRKDMLDEEREILDRYLDQGGNMLVLLDPGAPESFRSFLARWGVAVGSGQIIDRAASVAGNETILILNSDRYIGQIPEPTLESILSIGNLTGAIGSTIYPGVAPLKPAEGTVFVPDVFASPDPELVLGVDTNIFGVALAITSNSTVLIDGPDGSGSTDDGPYYPAMAIRAFAPLGVDLPEDFVPSTPASLVVFGDTDFASNQYFFSGFNGDIFLNSVNWLVGDTSIASIRPKPFAFRELIVNEDQSYFMRFSGWLLLPTLMAVAGGLVWWRRR